MTKKKFQTIIISIQEINICFHNGNVTFYSILFFKNIEKEYSHSEILF